MEAAGLPDTDGEGAHLIRAQHGHGDLEPGRARFEAQGLPLHVRWREARQIASDRMQRRHAAARMNSSTASEQPLACAPSARPSSRKPPSTAKPTSSVRMVVTELKLARSQWTRIP